jgi:long-subunit fatty acid transport protein
MKTNMKRLMRVAAPAVMVPLLCAGPLDAQVTKVGTTAATFLSIPVGARALGMGGAFVGLANDASAMYWNPGGIARLAQNEAIFVHANWIADISFNYGGVVIPVQDVGTFGVSFTSLTMGDMERTTEELPEGTGTTFSAGSFAVGLAYARSLTDWFSIGGNIKFIDEHIWNESATGFALDVGTLLSTPFPGLKFGAGISNFGTKMHMSGDDLLVLKPISTNAGASQSVNAILSTDQFDLPLTLRIGFAYQPLVTDDQVLTLVVDAVHPNDNSESMSVGVEYTTLQKILSVRAGYNGIGMQDGESQFTLGGGLQYEVWPGAIARIDYAFERFGRLNDIHKFGVGLLF